jgi:cell wall-associated NlpC family hydrolase
VYGGAGPSVFDCSGLVYWASHKLGVNMPRTTYGMLGSSHLYRVSSPRRGDLAFYGTGHVEFVTTWAHTTFGAQHAGTRVGWHRWNAYWHPTMYFRIR